MLMDNNTWSIDRIEENIAILENRTTQELKEVDINLLPSNIKEGSIVNYKNNTYTLELSKEEKIRQEILERFQRLRKN